MTDFAESVDYAKLQDKLINVLNRLQSFQYFEWQIDNSGEYKQQWFDFKKLRYIRRVKEQIYFKNVDFNE